MGRISTKKNKNIYQLTREKLGYSREKAAETAKLEPFKIERIENEKVQASPWDVMAMSSAYKEPQLCNHYCSNECPIGMKYVPEITFKELSQIVLEMLVSLNSVEQKRERLMEISCDGVIENNELKDFISIQSELERISVTVETLQLWTEKMLSSGKIDIDNYNKMLKNEEQSDKQ